MVTILLVVYITAAVSMIVLILLQRSEGGALGMGGGGGGLVSGRGAANLLTRVTAVLATIFFITAIGLGILGHRAPPSSAVVGSPAKAPAGESTPASEPAPMEKAPRAFPRSSCPNSSPKRLPHNRPAPQLQPRRPLHCRNFRSRSKRRRAARVRLDKLL